ncbi:MAG TPA: hypothetical protein VFK33_12170 [Bacillales bacterium]|nr:hypothetical protein [Bacillales bacterium]
MRKKKLAFYSMAGVAAAGLGTYLMKEKPLRIKLTNRSENHDENVFPIEKAGHPEPDQIQDNKMVSEGAQFGVQYYDQMKKEKK